MECCNSFRFPVITLALEELFAHRPFGLPANNILEWSSVIVPSHQTIECHARIA